MVKNLPAMWETWFRSLGQEDLLEKGMATHSGILAWRIPWAEEPGGLQSIELQSHTTEATEHVCMQLSKIKDCSYFFFFTQNAPTV